MKKAIFENAYTLHEKFPDTFELPDPDKIKKLKPGDFAKICAGRERFWVEITKREHNRFEGRIDNDLVFSQEHGYSFNDCVCFEEHNIYDFETVCPIDFS